MAVVLCQKRLRTHVLDSLLEYVSVHTHFFNPTKSKRKKFKLSLSRHVGEVEVQLYSFFQYFTTRKVHGFSLNGMPGGPQGLF